MSDPRTQALVRLCRDAGIALLADDVYGDLQHEGPRPLPCNAFDWDGGVIVTPQVQAAVARLGALAAPRLSAPAYSPTCAASSSAWYSCCRACSNSVISPFITSASL